MFISSIGMESLLSGGIGLELVVSVAGSVLVEVSGATGVISEENPASRVCNLLDTRSLILKSSFFLSLIVNLLKIWTFVTIFYILARSMVDLKPE